MSWFEVVQQRGSIVDGKVREYQVTVQGRLPRGVSLEPADRPTNGLSASPARPSSPAVAGQQDGFVRQGEELPADAVDKSR